MKPTELRIGNICLHKINGEENGKEIIIDAQDLVAITQFLVANKTCPYYPIPLTEEWFEKFGFESSWHDQIGTTYHKGKFEIINPNDEGEFGICLNDIDVFTKYVHQLQNLYFALTGEELTLQK